MARYQITLAYDGTHFFGFQRQGKQRTVQVVMEAALRQLNWQGISLLAAGRTDTGVHASGQVVAFDLDWSHSPEALGRALNAHLPPDISVKAVQMVNPAFHPRFDARARCYQYHLFSEPERNPLRERYAWRVWPVVKIEQLQAVARLLLGTHDFAAFGTPPRVGGSTIRTVFSTRWELQTGGLLFEIWANAFLYHMVRRLVYLQVLVGQGRLLSEQFALAVEHVQPQTPGLAPPNGLFLTEVRFESESKSTENVTTQSST
jgi:tRNA pseudouridine38-40 synthase